MNHAQMSYIAATMLALLFGATSAGGKVTEPAIERGVPNARELPAVFVEGQMVTVPVLREPWCVGAADDRDIQVAGDLDPSVSTIDLGPLGVDGTESSSCRKTANASPGPRRPCSGVC